MKLKLDITPDIIAMMAAEVAAGERAVTDRLSLNQEGFAVDLDPVAGARVRDFCHPQVDARGFRPEPRITEFTDSIRTPGDGTHQNGRAAIGSVDCLRADVWIGEEHLDGGGKGVHHVRRAMRSTCGRVQIGSGFDSISRRTHSSRSRSGIIRA